MNTAISDTQVTARYTFTLWLVFSLFAVLSMRQGRGQDTGDTAVEFKVSRELVQGILRHEIPDRVSIPGKTNLAKVPLWKDLRIEDTVATLPDRSIHLSFQAPDRVTLQSSAQIRGKIRYEQRKVKLGFLGQRKSSEKRTATGDWQTHTGDVTCPVSVRATYRLSLVPARRSGSSRAAAVPDIKFTPISSQVDVGQIDIAGLSKVVDKVLESAGKHFGAKQVQRQLTEELAKSHTISVADQTPSYLSQLLDLDAASLRLYPQALHLMIPAQREKEGGQSFLSRIRL